MGRLLLDSQAPPPPPCKQPHSLSETLAIPLIFVFFVTLAYVFLTSIFQCIRHRQQTAANRPLQPVASVVPDPGCVQQLERIPVVFYTKSSPTFPSPPQPSPSADTNINHEPENCPVCLAEYVEGEEVRVLPNCGHTFHKDCIDRWLLTRSSFCPVCRNQVILRAVEPARDNCDNARNHDNMHANRGQLMHIGLYSHYLTVTSLL